MKDENTYIFSPVPFYSKNHQGQRHPDLEPPPPRQKGNQAGGLQRVN
jgi:hypothetical protein